MKNPNSQSNYANFNNNWAFNDIGGGYATTAMLFVAGSLSLGAVSSTYSISKYIKSMYSIIDQQIPAGLTRESTLLALYSESKSTLDNLTSQASTLKSELVGLTDGAKYAKEAQITTNNGEIALQTIVTNTNFKNLQTVRRKILGRYEKITAYSYIKTYEVIDAYSELIPFFKNGGPIESIDEAITLYTLNQPEPEPEPEPPLQPGVFSIRALDVSSLSIYIDLYQEDFKDVSGQDVDASIYIKTTTLRNIFQFQTDANSVDNFFATDTKYFVSTNGNLSTSTNVNYEKIINPLNANLDFVRGLDNNTINDLSGQNLIRYDFVKYLAFKLTGTVHGVDLFKNEAEVVQELGKSGYNLYDEHILPVFNTSGTPTIPLSDLNKGNTNITRHLLGQMADSAIHRERFKTGTPLTVNGVVSNDYSLRATYLPQPVMIVDGDKFVFELVINPNENQHEVTSVEQLTKRTYRIALEAVPDNTKTNTLPIMYNETGTLIEDEKANSYINTNLYGTGYTSSTSTGVFASQDQVESGTGTAIDPNITTENIQLLEQTPLTNTINLDVASVYRFNEIPYSNNDYVGLTNGTYTITGIPTSHPLGFVTRSSNFKIISGTIHGQPTNSSINGNVTLPVDVQHYTGNLTFEITGNIGIISYHCYFHGYMGGENRIKYYIPNQLT